MEDKQNKYRVVLICAALIAVILVAYEPIRHNEFVIYDDGIYITENPNIQSGFNPESIKWAFTTHHSGHWHPLTWLSHMLDYQLFGLNPVGHHLVNLFLHIINSLLLFWILRQMTDRIWASAFIACLFAIHPLHVESVAWAAERKDVLSSFFWMITVATYIKYSEKPGIVRYLLVLVSMALGLMSKGMLVTLPFVLLLLDYWPLRRFTFSKETVTSRYSTARLLTLFLEKIPFFVLVFICSILVFLAAKSGGTVSELTKVPLSSRIANVSVSYISYIIKMIYPVRLAALYPYEINIPLWKSMTCLSLLVFVTLVVVLAARKKPYLIIGWFLYLGILVPVIGLVQVGAQSMADRYTYISLIGLFIILVWGASDLISTYRYKKVVCSVSSAVIILIMIILTRIQVGYWENSFTLCGRAIEVTENNYFMHNNLGSVFQATGNFDEAACQYRKALSIDPNYVKGHYNLGLVLSAQGNLNEAIMHFERAAEYNPNLFEAHNNLGFILSTQGRLNEAIKHYRIAAQIEPNQAKVQHNLGMALKLQGKLDEAIEHYRRALEIDPNYASVHFDLGIVLELQGEVNESIIRYNRAIQLKPDFILAYNNLAWILAAYPDPKVRKEKQAIEFAERAAELTNYQNAGILDTLAVAQAAIGEFGRAIKTAEKAIEIATKAQNNELVKDIRKKLQLYQQKKPYLEPVQR